MPVITVETPFRHAEDGINVTEYKPGTHTVSERCAKVAVDQLQVAKRSGRKNSKSSDKVAE